ncbi:MAG: LuxR C-terminal-related transcriptional regulator, partial [Nitrospinales bacterium]
MAETQQTVSLPEKDYLAILATITALHRCETRVDLLNFFKTNLLTLFEAQGGLYAWTDPDIASPQIIDPLNIPESDVEAYQEFIRNDFMATEIVRKSRPVLACDVDLPREGLSKQTDDFFKNNPKFKRNDHPYFDCMKTYLLTLDIPEPTLGIAIHRLTPNDKPWTLREVRLLELLRAHIFHSIKTIILSDELAKFKSISTALANIPTAIAVVSPDTRIIFGNPAYQALIPFEPGQRLPKALGDLFQKEISRYEPPYQVDDSIIEIPFFNLPQGMFRLSITLLTGRGLEEDKCYLLRMKPAMEPYSKMNLLMQNSRLTQREMEVACLVRDGFNDREIAGRLFISLTTAKNHVK